MKLKEKKDTIPNQKKRIEKFTRKLSEKFAATRKKN